MDLLKPYLARSFPWVVAVALASPLVVPAAVNPGIVTIVALLGGGVLGLAGAVASPRRLAGPSAIVTLSAFVCVAWFAITSAMAANPVMSLLGIAGQHNGTALFALGAVWLLAGITCADAKGLRTTLAVVAVSGAVYASTAFWELLSIGAQRDQGLAAGIFENSTSLSEALAIAALAALVWGLTSRSTPLRWTAWGIGLFAAAGVAFASSRTALLGLAAAALYAALVVRGPRIKHRAITLAATFSVGAVAVTGLLVAFSAGVFGPSARTLLNVAANSRDIIWHSALAQWMQSPLWGSGLEQFSAWLRWSVAGGTFDAQVTNDPHSMVLAIALGGGVIGLVVATAATTAILWALTKTTEEAGRPWSVSLLAAIPVVALGCGLVGWISPVAMLGTCAISGATLGGTAARIKPPKAVPGSSALAPLALASGYALGAFALGLALFGFAAIPAERSFADISRSADPNTGEQSAALYTRWPDPAFATHALGMLTPLVLNGDAQSASLVESVLSASPTDASWRADLAVNQMLAVQALQAPGERAFERFADIAAQGLNAEPVSGLWDTLAAKQAKLLGLPDDARTYARRALAFPLEAETRAAMQDLAGQ